MSKEIRHRISRNSSGNIPSTIEQKDWSMEDAVEFPSRSQIRTWVREEFYNRWRNIGLQYTGDGSSTGTIATGGYDAMVEGKGYTAINNNDPIKLSEWDQSIYKGPKTSWARMTSSAIVVDENDETNVKNGFILVGNGNFHDTYGFDKGDGYNGGGGDVETLLGYDINNNPHKIEEPEYKYRPTPGIVSVESEDIDPGKNFRRTTVNFTVWSHAQLDYLDPYFFKPGTSVIVEWGWNTYPREALLTLDEKSYTTKIPKLWNNLKDEPTENDLEPPKPPVSKQLRLGQGNYGFAMGLIHSFNYSIRDDGGYDCTCSISCMSEIGQQVMIQTGRIQKKETTGRTQDIRTFTKSTLRRLLVGNSQNDYANFIRGKRTSDQMIKEAREIRSDERNKDTTNELGELSKEEEEAIRISRGRFFSFDPYTSSKPYYAGKNQHEGTYITVGYLLDIFNMFFSRTSEGNSARIWQISCYNSRAIAHPNIKSIDGEVLLIPNSLAPRWNNTTYHGSTIKVDSNGASSSASYNLLQQGTNEDANKSSQQTTQAFLDMIASMYDLDSSALTLEEAIRKSPRDDLYRILAYNSTSGYNWQNPLIAGKLHSETRSVVVGNKKVDYLREAWEEAENTIRPFPDYATPNISGPTQGYSGRIADLFVNLNVIDGAMDKNENCEKIILDIMKQVSTAAGDIWDFQIVGADANTSSNTVLRLIDSNFSGTDPVSEQKEKAWLFPTHRGDSIVREMTLDVDPKSELSSQIIFGNIDGENGIYARQNDDLILKHANNPFKNTMIKTNKVEKTKNELPDNVKFIVALSSKGLGEGKLGYYVTYEADKNLKGKYDISYVPKNQTDRVILTAKNEKEKQVNLQKARTDGEENSIKTKTKGFATDRRRFGSATGLGDIGKKRSWRVYANSKFVDKITKSKNDIKSVDLNNLRTALVGKRFNLDDDMLNEDSGTDFNDKELIYDPKVQAKLPVNKEYEIINVSISDINSVSQAQINKIQNMSNLASYSVGAAGFLSGAGYPTAPAANNNKNLGLRFYIITIQELEGTGLSNSDLGRVHNKKQKNSKTNSRGPTRKYTIPFDIQKKMDERGLTRKDVENEIQLQTSGKSSGDSNLFKGQQYGTSYDDYEIDVEMVDPDRNRMLENCKLDRNVRNNIIFNQRLDGVDLSLKLDGIEGLRLYDVFNCTGVPTKYYERGVFAIAAIKHSISNGDWTTDLDCMFFPG